MKNKLWIIFVLVILSFIFSGCANKNKKTDVKQENQESITEAVSKEDINSVIFPIQISIGYADVVDLNGDGSDDTVSFSLDTSIPYQANIVSLTVNGEEYADKLVELGICMDTPHGNWYYIVDIDKSDKYKEIALLDEGPSGDPETYFLRFRQNEIEYIGSITDFPHEATCEFLGDGTIIGRYRLSILQTWWAPGKWKLNGNGFLQKLQEDIYYACGNLNNEFTPKLIKDFLLYTEPDLESGQVMVNAGSEVTFKSTDNKHWVFMGTDDGIEGWFYMENSSYILLEGKQVESTTIFENLCFTD